MTATIRLLTDGEELISFEGERTRSNVVEDPRTTLLEHRRVLETTLDQLAGLPSSDRR
jgi:hypothetical protein